MVRTTLTRIDIKLISVFESIRKEFAEKIKRQYNLDEITIPATLSSQILAGKYCGKNQFNFKIKKIGNKSGVLLID